MDATQYDNRRELFGMRVRYFRTQRKMTQKELGEILDVDGQQVGRIERGMVGLSIDRIFEISDALGLKSASKLFEFDDMLD